MHTTRLEAFSDGVLAIIITIMVLELHAPEEATFDALKPLMPIFSAYVLSFVYLAIYWNNHHHLFHATEHVDGRVMWANMHLLFWLSLIPFATSWLAGSDFAAIPTALYGIVLLAAAIGYSILTTAITAHTDSNHLVREAIGRDWAGKISIVCYIAGLILAFVDARLALLMYVGVAILWLVPDPRIGQKLNHKH
jgi:uncharacterized membrane protein